MTGSAPVAKGEKPAPIQPGAAFHARIAELNKESTVRPRPTLQSSPPPFHSFLGTGGQLLIHGRRMRTSTAATDACLPRPISSAVLAQRGPTTVGDCAAVLTEENQRQVTVRRHHNRGLAIAK